MTLKFTGSRFLAHSQAQRFIAIFLIALGALFVGLLPPQTAYANSAAKNYIKIIAPRAIAIAGSRSSKSQKKARYLSLVRRYGAIREISSFSLGRYRKNLPASRRAEYQRLVAKFMAKFFLTYTGQFEGNGIKIGRVKPRGRGDLVVDAGITYRDGRRPQPMSWRILRRGGGYKVFDVKLLGIWLTLQMRSKFVTVLRENNGNFSTLLAWLKKEVR